MSYIIEVPPYAPYDSVQPAEVDAACRLLVATGHGVSANSEHSRMTPYRLAHYLRYWTRPYGEDEPRFTTFENRNPVIDQMITIGPIDFWACCSHHLLPFFGQAWFGYVPNEKLVGLSMVPLVVKNHCARPWLQETMTHHLAAIFEDKLEPDGLGIVTRAIHTCQMLDLKGPPVPEMTFSVMHGSFFTNEKTRAEFLSFVGK